MKIILSLIVLVSLVSCSSPKSNIGIIEQERIPASFVNVKELLDAVFEIRKDAVNALNNFTKPVGKRYVKDYRSKIASLIPPQGQITLAEDHFITTMRMAESGRTPGSIAVSLTIHSKSKEDFNNVTKLVKTITSDSVLSKMGTRFEMFKEQAAAGGYLIRGTSDESIQAYNGMTVKFDLALATEKELDKFIKLFSDSNFVSINDVKDIF